MTFWRCEKYTYSQGLNDLCYNDILSCYDFLAVFVGDCATMVLLKSKTPKVYKNKKLNNANFSDYTLNDYQIFLHLVSKLGKVDAVGKYQQPEQLKRIHTLTAKEFSIIFGLDLKSTYRVLQKAASKLIKSSIRLEKPELFSTWEINICSMVEYNHKVGSITIKFTDDIMPYLAQVKQKFVLYNLKEIANFGSLYTTRLYELIQEFKDTGCLIKSVEQLKTAFAIKNQYKLYADFKRKTFAHAVNEINSQYELNLKFDEIKLGKKVVALKFTFTPTFIRKCVNSKTGKEQNIYIKPKRKVLENLEPSQMELDIS
jgi:plasmid replication initiation protein